MKHQRIRETDVVPDIPFRIRFLISEEITKQELLSFWSNAYSKVGEAIGYHKGGFDCDFVIEHEKGESPEWYTVIHRGSSSTSAYDYVGIEKKEECANFDVPPETYSSMTISRICPFCALELFENEVHVCGRPHRLVIFPNLLEPFELKVTTYGDDGKPVSQQFQFGPDGLIQG